METDVPPEDCRACARCCFSQAYDHVRVFGCDWERMNEAAQAFTMWRDNRCYMRLEDGHCAALQVDADRGTLSCGIYEMRPDVCRSLDRGTSTCLGERHQKAGRPEELMPGPVDFSGLDERSRIRETA